MPAASRPTFQFGRPAVWRPLLSGTPAGAAKVFQMNQAIRPWSVYDEDSDYKCAAVVILFEPSRLRPLGGFSVSNIKLTVNGKPVSAEVEDRTLLVHLLRDHLGLTGTHIGCDTSQCGACMVHIDGRSVKSCTVLVGQADGSSVTTIEGISKGDELHPMQAAFRDNHGLQCGYCTPGMIMASIDIVNRHGPDLDEATLRQELEGNICRCTGYHNIVKSVLDAAGRMKVAQAAE
jgi:carbon-monoxide dehydrogenase small subunit